MYDVINPSLFPVFSDFAPGPIYQNEHDNLSKIIFWTFWGPYVLLSGKSNEWFAIGVVLPKPLLLMPKTDTEN